MSMSSRCVNKPGGCLWTSLPVLTWSASTFSSASLSWSKRLTDTGTQLEKVSLFFHWCFRKQVRNIFDFLNTRTGLLLWQNRSPCSNNWIFGLWLGLLGVFTTSSNFWNPILSSTCLWRKSLEEVEVTQNLFVNDFSRSRPDGLRNTISWECFVKNDSVRSCLTELQSFLQSKFDVNPIHSVLMFLPNFLLVPSKTRCIQVNFIWIFKFDVHWIHRREEYRLSFAQNLSSWYQSWIHDGA